MSARQDVFQYLEKKPKAPLNEVLDEFSKAKQSTIRRYFFEYQKLDKKVGESKSKKVASLKSKPGDKKTASKKIAGGKSVKQQVFDYMQENPGCKLKDLASAFPSAQKTTLGNYRRQWLKENEATKQELTKSKKSEIISFLVNNPGSNINDLKKVFPEVANKLVTVFRSWKNSQSARTKIPKAPKTRSSKPAKPKSLNTPEITQKAQGWLEKHKDTIARQKEIIEKQKTRIEILKSQLPKTKRPKFIDSLKKFLTNKFSKN
jgi:hypothetical protein